MEINQIKSSNVCQTVLMFLLIVFLEVHPLLAQPLTSKKALPDYLTQIQRTADSVLKFSPNNARSYYFKITRSIYDRALKITMTESAIQSGTGNSGFTRAMVQLQYQLRADLFPSSCKQTVTPIPDLFQRTVDAAMRNFSRYQQPKGLDRERLYLWVMIQVFENLNQINAGFLQVGLSTKEKDQVWQRLKMQQQMIVQLKSKYER
ncbi:hypothetical protein DIU31_009095 [Mucilaginibacter rubeus]|uniref:Uncharacterized protein n=1 Tax=Mucilaginibacter rubeus TaxID=2027860 RepID=A0AAE6JF54_9SPHI|nr:MULTISPECIES: hypothetical protein [Mucilaginibacter]QEM03662.1 hypothetical protein DIU31_009095 [Mucilaginibacter rubeus]QEM16273.1 hypothetical protein DIU38_009190 [Mucilaginibacter gossypii]QTE40965.1 hypothetical protein J3L19_18575 [Mucilaginibacter rubeus]QTE47568.1 hypothetical protein J3L21_18550 [Mucilaginibacter rubeus]QTE58960.1 hypothetical protein J3L23_10215 [Mucilaginibacter rubeus]